MTKPVRGENVAHVSAPTARLANSVGVVPFVKNEERFGVFSRLMAAIVEIWPKKTSACVSYLTGVTERSVQFWLAGQTHMSVDHVTALLKTDEGFRILEAIMGDSQVEWWLTTKLAFDLRKSRRAIKAQQKRIEQLKALQSQIDLFDQ